jgi:hypothetical protein
MSNRYTNIILTFIALLLGAIVAKLYLPAAQLIGPQMSLPTLGEVAAARKIVDPANRRARLEAVSMLTTPLILRERSRLFVDYGLRPNNSFKPMPLRGTA